MTLRLPPGMARPHIPTNPDTARITAELWEFAHCVLSLEPTDFVFAGIYADKSGYHNTVTVNLQRWPGEYSTRLAADLKGVRDKARALDIKSKQAAAGAKPAIMATYGARMRAAAKARDPRVQHWREVLGQFDLDQPPEAIDFQSLGERQPDDTHTWHFHWSILAMFVALAEAYEGMLSVLYGEPLAGWQAYKAGDEDMPDLGTKIHVGNFATDPRYPAQGEEQTLSGIWQGSYYYAILAKLNTDAIRAEQVALRAVVEQLAAAIAAGGGSVDTAAILAGVDERLERLAAEQRDAVADLGEGGAAQVRADAS